VPYGGAPFSDISPETGGPTEPPPELVVELVVPVLVVLVPVVVVLVVDVVVLVDAVAPPALVVVAVVAPPVPLVELVLDAPPPDPVTGPLLEDVVVAAVEVPPDPVVEPAPPCEGEPEQAAVRDAASETAIDEVRRELVFMVVVSVSVRSAATRGSSS
jgi:hypothetical protein